MEISLSELSEVKGIGKKTIQRIREYKLADEGYISEYDEDLHLDINSVNKGDCLELMNGIKNESIDLIVTDPPYLIDYQSNRRVKKDKFDKILNDKNSNQLIKNFFQQAYRILKNNSALYVFCSWHNVDFFKQEEVLN